MTENYEVLALRYASRMTVRSEVYLNHHLYGEPDEPVQMDYYVWVIRGHDTTIVVDSGYSLEGGRNRARGHLEHPTTLVRRAGVDPSAAQLLAITHAHYDHIGNLVDYPNARIVISGSEFAFWNGPTADRILFHHSVEDAELQHLRTLQEAGRLDRFHGSTALAPGIEMTEVGGHTHGQSIITVPTTEGMVVLASDAAHYLEELDRDRPFVIVDDLDRMYRGFDHLRSLARDGAIVVPGHDPCVMHEHTPLEGDLEGWGIRIGTL
ncbi:N-acyl homoserine lactonase family protein [Brachybacterium sp. ACRRE]|uniref:N-acyl homoserine lactonase family protein n=1 Tax=Brachybacterium sp. ACRRE TaxID=2918184 RepID=UPI001EF3BE42|nr:N-acyl homoserine lactonase family protein [Brachybacterium sp. ACRRE]MCG7310725.1 N-acyl homoserine lactonase family protein [Brachybacterium sp. ACRRE]